MGGAVGYGFELVNEEMVHEVISGIWDAVNKVTGILIVVIIYSNMAVFKDTNDTLKFTIQEFYTEDWTASVRWIFTKFRYIIILFFQI
jgi:hypothetical protein